MTAPLTRRSDDPLTTPDPEATSDTTGLREGERLNLRSLNQAKALAVHPDPTPECHCPPCPGRGNDGHGLTHCAECCFGTGVEAEPGCPVHHPTPDASPDPAVVTPAARDVDLRQRVTENPQEFLMRTLSKDQWRVVADCLRIEVAAAREADRAEVRAAWAADVANVQDVARMQREDAIAYRERLADLVAKIEALAVQVNDEAQTHWYRHNEAADDGDLDRANREGEVAEVFDQTRSALRALIPADAATALDAVREQAKAEALSEAAELMRSCKDSGHWNLRDPRDPETAYSPDVWLEHLAARHTPEATP